MPLHVDQSKLMMNSFDQQQPHIRKNTSFNLPTIVGEDIVPCQFQEEVSPQFLVPSDRRRLVWKMFLLKLKNHLSRNK